MEIGTPITPPANSYSSFAGRERAGGNVLYLLHREPFRHNTAYAHLDKYAGIVHEGKSVSRGGRALIDNELGKLKIVAYSGATGTGPGGGRQTPHLHFGITSTTNNQRYSLDPFTLGIDAEKPYGGVDQGMPLGGRPVYWDGETEIPHRAKDKKVYLKRSLDTLVQRVQQSDLDQATKKEILDKQNKPEELRDYLGMRVLQKKPGADGKLQYEFMPGPDSLMYGLMLEFYGRTSKERFIAMLPFIFPPLKEAYQKANPDVKL